jgi:predicted ATP-grasp superfamily ATP-dependent carboligase
MRVFVYEHVTASWDHDTIPTPELHSLRREGEAMLRALTVDWQRVPDVEIVTGPDAAFRANVMASDATLLIAPECDGILEQLARTVQALGKPLLGCSPGAIRLTADKLALAHHWDSHGVPTPTTWDSALAPRDRRLVVKRRDGAGSQQMRVQYLTEPIPGMIAQEYVAGVAVSVAFILGPRACIALPACAQHLHAATFAYEGGSAPLTPELTARATALARRALEGVPGLAGYVGVDLVVGEKQTWAIEINPRLTTSYVGLRALTPDNLAEVWWRAWRGVEVPTLSWLPQRVTFTPDGVCHHSSV